MRIAFLGLGIMGGSMAKNLVKAGHQVTVWNRSSEKEIAGAKRAATPREAAANAEAIWICVSDTAAFQRHGENFAPHRRKRKGAGGQAGNESDDRAHLRRICGSAHAG